MKLVVEVPIQFDLVDVLLAKEDISKALTRPENRDNTGLDCAMKILTVLEQSWPITENK